MFIILSSKKFMILLIRSITKETRDPKVSKRMSSVFVSEVFIFNQSWWSVFRYVPYKINFFVFQHIFYGYYHFQVMRVSLDSLSPYEISIYILQQIWPSSCLFPEIKGVQEINTQNDNFLMSRVGQQICCRFYCYRDIRGPKVWF